MGLIARLKAALVNRLVAPGDYGPKGIGPEWQRGCADGRNEARARRNQ